VLILSRMVEFIGLIDESTYPSPNSHSVGWRVELT
jgi:hypothetical protein